MRQGQHPLQAKFESDVSQVLVTQGRYGLAAGGLTPEHWARRFEPSPDLPAAVRRSRPRVWRIRPFGPVIHGLRAFAARPVAAISRRTGVPSLSAPSQPE